MFLRVLAAFVVLLALLWLVMYATSVAAVKREINKPWPYALGSLKQPEPREDLRVWSEETQYTTLIDALDVENIAPEKYVAVQTAKKDDAIDPPPSGAGVAENEPVLAKIVRLVLDSGDRVIWRGYERADVPGLLAAAALDRARSGDTAAAWDDLHAVWILARSLPATSGWRAKRRALLAVRQANAVARKLPAPPPSWFAELAAFDPRRQTAVFIHDSTKIQLRPRRRLGVIDVLFKPLFDRYEISTMRHGRLSAEAMASSKPCRIDAAALGAAEAGSRGS